MLSLKVGDWKCALKKNSCELRHSLNSFTNVWKESVQKAFVCRGSPLVKHNKTDALTIRSQPKAVGFLFEQVG